VQAMSTIHLTHATTLRPKEVVDYFVDPKKIAEWFANGDAGCSPIPVKNGVAIMVLQDHYLEWIFPQPLPFTHYWVAPASDVIPFNFHQIDFTLHRPILSRVNVILNEADGNTRVEVSITGDFDERMKCEIEYDWKSISSLYPLGTVA
jgi:hypothetical protein